MALEQRYITSLFRLLVWLKLTLEKNLFQGEMAWQLMWLQICMPMCFHYCPTLLFCDFILYFCSNQKENTEQMLRTKLVSHRTIKTICNVLSALLGSRPGMEDVCRWGMRKWSVVWSTPPAHQTQSLNPFDPPHWIPCWIPLTLPPLNSVDPPPESPRSSPWIPSTLSPWISLTFPPESPWPFPLNPLDPPPESPWPTSLCTLYLRGRVNKGSHDHAYPHTHTKNNSYTTGILRWPSVLGHWSTLDLVSSSACNALFHYSI